MTLTPASPGYRVVEWGRCRPSSLALAYEFEAVGWEDFDGNRHRGTPSDLNATHGVLVHATDPDNVEGDEHFWAYAGRFEDWAEWWVYIGAIMEMYGMDLAA